MRFVVIALPNTARNSYASLRDARQWGGPWGVDLLFEGGLVFSTSGFN